MIWLSENINTAELSLKAHYIAHYLILYLKSLSLNDLETEICLNVYLAIKVANFVRECLPAPPSPTSIPWPLLNLMIRLILQTYEIAYSNNVMFMAAALYFSLNSCNFYSRSLVSSYLCLYDT